MTRAVRLIVVASALAASSGCAGGGWYRAIGNLPGVAWTDYAFTFYCDTATQLYPASPAQIESSMLQALPDMGFKDIQPPVREGVECVIRGKAPDGRHMRVKIAPQGAMTIAAVAISPPVGDYELSRDLLRRVALNFGTLMRAYMPVDTTLPLRINPPNAVPSQPSPKPPEALKGEGLRPDLRQEAASPDELTVPGSVVPPIMGMPGMLNGFVPSMSYPNPPNVPYAPWPYYPANDQ
jgi:hypothetical protein